MHTGNPLPFPAQALIRQITASVTFLPLLDEPCSFDLLVYTSAVAAVPKAWEESDPRYIAPNESAEVKLRSFTTSIHKVRGGDVMRWVIATNVLVGAVRWIDSVVTYFHSPTTNVTLPSLILPPSSQVAPTVSYRSSSGM